MYGSKAIAALAAFVKTSACIAFPLQMRWTSDYSESDNYPSTFGPDGPWQAVVVHVGNRSTPSNRRGGVAMPLWPSGSDLTQILTVETGGNYSISNSSTAKTDGSSLGNSDSWFAQAASNSTNSGRGVFDEIAILSKLSDVDAFPINASIMAADSYWVFDLPSGKNYTTDVGILGLGPDAEGEPDKAKSILNQMKTKGDITSNSFGLHMGSVAHGQSGSMILGGYDQSRALGNYAVFRYSASPLAFLLDVSLGVEEGGSPYTKTPPSSLYKGSNGSEVGDLLIKQFGGAKNSVLVTPNPAVPYIYLPYGTCEAVASYLPMDWNKDVNLYTWNTADPSFNRIINSPAYMGITLSDMNSKNLTIKIPLQLLNLTLTSPIVTTPITYFPCQPQNASYGFWTLGRAFLQAAFFGINFDQNISYIAQAPGPDMDQQVIREIKSTDTTITTNPIDSFRKSWASHWTPLPASSNSPADGSTSSASSSSKLSAGAIAGIVLATLIGIAALLLLALFLLRQHKKRQTDGSDDGPKYTELNVDGREAPVTEYYEPQEMAGGQGRLAEMGKPLPHEMEAQSGMAEAPGTQSPVEIWASNVPVHR